MRVEDMARQAVEGPRNEAYGSPVVNHSRTAALWRTYLLEKYADRPGDMVDWICELSAEDVCNLNILQKMSREMASETMDGLVDIIGYTINVAKIRGYEDGNG